VVLGEKFFNKIRGKGIAIHSQAPSSSPCPNPNPNPNDAPNPNLKPTPNLNPKPNLYATHPQIISEFCDDYGVPRAMRGALIKKAKITGGDLGFLN
jgi:hypothetical protein